MHTSLLVKISKLFNGGGDNYQEGNCLTNNLMHLIMTIHNIYGLWVGISTILKIMS